MTEQSARIADYALIGDGETAALVDRWGSIAWCCLPRFDSDACFAALLGDEENGCWRMKPAAPIVSTSRTYRGHSLILETLFETDDGAVAVLDFMPIRGDRPDIIRIVEGRRGKVEMMCDLALRFDYGRIHPLVQNISDVRSIAKVGPDGVALDFSTPIGFEDRRFVSRFTIAEGERQTFVLTWFPSHREPPARVDAMHALHDTERYWREWTSHIDYRGEHREIVIRSLITLKAMIHRPTGGIVAAPTTSLPENPGGWRNWDYRYCWLRDATFTLLAFLQAGLREEAEAWIEWLRRAVGGDPIDLQPFYTVVGDRRMPEWEVDGLPGFDGAGPVRIGNGAAGQCQLDIYGEVLDALFQAREQGIGCEADMRLLATLIVGRLESLWQKPDAGIWESRAEPRQHSYSKVMCWVAFDRAARWFADDAVLSGRYRALAEQVHALICEKGFDPAQQAFTQVFDDPLLDASTLRIPMVGFLPAEDPRMVGTVAAVERQLMHHGLVHRYDTGETDDGVGGGEGAFLAACYWLANVYARQGRKDDAQALFDRTTGLANDLGLLSEEAMDGVLLGNFPQALTHLSLVVCAMSLAGAGPPDRRSQPALSGDNRG